MRSRRAAFRADHISEEPALSLFFTRVHFAAAFLEVTAAADDLAQHFGVDLYDTFQKTVNTVDVFDVEFQEDGTPPSVSF